MEHNCQARKKSSTSCWTRFHAGRKPEVCFFKWFPLLLTPYSSLADHNPLYPKPTPCLTKPPSWLYWIFSQDKPLWPSGIVFSDEEREETLRKMKKEKRLLEKSTVRKASEKTHCFPCVLFLNEEVEGDGIVPPIARSWMRRQMCKSPS